MIDWLNTQFYRDFGYGLIYPQLFPHHKRRSDEAHAGAVAWGQQGAKNWLQLLNDYWIGPDKQYLCGSQLTIADYFGAAVVSIGELVGCDFSAYPNVGRWLDNMKKLKSWNQINEVFDGFRAANNGKELYRRKFAGASALAAAPAEADALKRGRSSPAGSASILPA